jgi:hypothetical protein
MELPVTYDPRRGAIVELPDRCPLCDAICGFSYDVHMVLVHPDTRPALAAMRAHVTAAKKPARKRTR